MAVDFKSPEVPTPTQDDVDDTLSLDLVDDINGASMADGDVAVFSLSDKHWYDAELAKIMWVEVRNETTGTTVTLHPALGAPNIPPGFGLPWSWDAGTRMCRFEVDGSVASGEITIQIGVASEPNPDAKKNGGSNGAR